MQVVLVDDDKLIRDEIKSLIDWEREGFTLAHEASNGKDALHWLKNHPAEIVITDIAMPVMDGIELIRALKEQRYRGQILVMSNYQEFDYVKDAMKYGAFDYCLKYKLDPPVLLGLLRDLAERIKDEYNERSRALRDARLRLIRDACLIAPGAEEIERFETLDAGRRFHVLYAQNLSALDPVASECLRLGADWVALSAGIGVVLLGEEFFGEAAVRQSLAECTAGLRRVAPDAQVAYGLTAVPFSGIHHRLADLREASKMFFYGGADVVLEDTRPIVPLIPAEEAEKALEDMLEAVRQVRRGAFAENLRNFLREAESLGADPRSVSGHLEAAALRMIQYFQRIRVGDRTIERLKDLIQYMSEVGQRAADQEAAFLRALQPYFDAETIGRQPVRMEIARAIQYMNSHLSGTLSLQEVASYVGLSRNHFCTIFRQETGMNFVEYLSSLRIEESKRLLTDPAYNVQQISYMVGIDNSRYFCRLFREHTGMSPTQFRKGRP